MHGSDDSTATKLGKKVISFVWRPLKAQMLQRQLWKLEKSWSDTMKLEWIGNWDTMSLTINELRLKNQGLRAQLRSSTDDRRELLGKAEIERQTRWESFLKIVRSRPEKTERLMRSIDPDFSSPEGWDHTESYAAEANSPASISEQRGTMGFILSNDNHLQDFEGEVVRTEDFDIRSAFMLWKLSNQAYQNLIKIGETPEGVEWMRVIIERQIRANEVEIGVYQGIQDKHMAQYNEYKKVKESADIATAVPRTVLAWSLVANVALATALSLGNAWWKVPTQSISWTKNNINFAVQLAAPASIANHTITANSITSQPDKYLTLKGTNTDGFVFDLTRNGDTLTGAIVRVDGNKNDTPTQNINIASINAIKDIWGGFSIYLWNGGQVIVVWNNTTKRIL